MPRDVRPDFLVVALACAALATPAHAAEFDWSPAGQVGQSRYGAAAARLGDGRVLLVGGRDHWTNPSTAAAELYAPATNAWTPAPPMTTARSWPAAVTLQDGRVLVAGGTDAGTEKSAEIFDPATATWTRTANSTSEQVDAPPVVLGDGRVLFVGGNHYSYQCSGGEVYDPATFTVAVGRTITVRLKLSATTLGALRHRTTRVTIRLLHQGTSVNAAIRA